MHQKTKEAIHILRGIDPALAEHVAELDGHLNAVTRSAWRHATWNDHNFEESDRARWQAETRAACQAADPFLA